MKIIKFLFSAMYFLMLIVIVLIGLGFAFGYVDFVKPLPNSVIFLSDANDIKNFYNFTMSDDLKSKLDFYWNSSNGEEYGVCIDGFYDGVYMNDDVNNYSVNVFLNNVLEYKPPYMKTTTGVFDCKGMVSLHNHPNTSFSDCRASGNDIMYFKQQHDRNGILFMMVQCASNKFVVYSWQDYGLGMKYEV